MSAPRNELTSDPSAWFALANEDGWNGPAEIDARNSENESLLCWALKDAPHLVKDVLSVASIDEDASPNPVIYAAQYRPDFLPDILSNITYDALIYIAGGFLIEIKEGYEIYHRAGSGSLQHVEGLAKNIEDGFAVKLDALQNLVAAGLNLNDANPYSDNPLFFSLLGDRTPLSAVELLVELRADLFMVTQNSRTSLMVSAGSLDVVRYLLKLGVDPKATSVGGVTPLMFAVMSGNTDCVDCLWDVSDKQAVDEQGGDILSGGYGNKMMQDYLNSKLSRDGLLAEVSGSQAPFTPTKKM